MVSKAIARFARISPRKARVIVNLVRGRQAGEALQLLEFTRKAARPSSRSSSRAPSRTPDPEPRASTSTRSSSRPPSSTRRRTSTCAAGARAPWAARPGSKRASATSPSSSASDRSDHHGSESPSVRLPPRRHQDVELQVVRGQGYAKWLHEDIRIKRAVKDYLENANIACVEVERAANKGKVIVFTARPGMVIGKGGKGIETLKSGNLEDRRQGRDRSSRASSRSPTTRSSSTSRRSARRRPARSSSPRTSRRSSSAASPSAAR